MHGIDYFVVLFLLSSLRARLQYGRVVKQSLFKQVI